jgi:hypothetical protein
MAKEARKMPTFVMKNNCLLLRLPFPGVAHYLNRD